jgi:hypothetical protein
MGKLSGALHVPGKRPLARRKSYPPTKRQSGNARRDRLGYSLDLMLLNETPPLHGNP